MFGPWGWLANHVKLSSVKQGIPSQIFPSHIKQMFEITSQNSIILKIELQNCLGVYTYVSLSSSLQVKTSATSNLKIQIKLGI